MDNADDNRTPTTTTTTTTINNNSYDDDDDDGDDDDNEIDIGTGGSSSRLLFHSLVTAPRNACSARVHVAT